MHHLLTVLLVCLASVSLAVAERPPNIIIIMVDDMGYGGLSCYDNTHFQTPEIDRLAAEGLLLTDYHSNGASCSPTRAAMMIGRYQHRIGCHVVINADPKHEDHIRGLPAAEWTLPEALKAGGYATAIFGKWHIGYKPEFHPLLHGFDQFNGFISGNIDAHSHYDRMQTFDWWQNDELKDEPGYHTDLITEHTLDFIERHKDEPFFIYASHGAPHTPLQARGSTIRRGPKKGKIPPWGAGEPEYSNQPGDENWLIKHFILPVDEGVGRIRQRLVDLGLSENTIVWFVSDNGAAPKNSTDTTRLRGHKGRVYEGGHRVPGIVWAPSRITPAQSDALVIGMDIMPTSLAMAKVAVPENHRFDGIDVSSALFEATPLAERTVLWGDSKRLALRKGPWKVVGQELYNLDSDPQEANDLAAQHPERAAAMAKECQAFFAELMSESPYDN